ncbi:hypothetical protein [Aliiglaciecola aliphaticivorans]
MQRFVILCIFCGFSFSSIAQNCASKADDLIAKYTIVTSVKHAQEQTKKLELWRRVNAVIHVYPQTEITEGWEKSHKNTIKPTRYFDNYQRAIEYQPGERVHGKQDKDWSFRYQLISDKMLKAMEHKSTSGTGCNTVDVFEYTNPQQKLILHWQPELQLIQSFKIITRGQEINWQLDSVTFDKQVIAQRFKTLMRYQTTDFADIGDDHSDPFLTKMVTQGFIEPGASGFFDDKGHALGKHTH